MVDTSEEFTAKGTKDTKKRRMRKSPLLGVPCRGDFEVCFCGVI
jgi:hypothetical protein